MEGTEPIEIGKWKTSSQTDLVAMYRMAVNGRSEREIAESFPASYMRYSKGVHLLIHHLKQYWAYTIVHSKE